MLQAAVLRSPHAHARLGAIHAKAALALSGVVAVVTGEDLGAIGRIPTRLGHRIGSVECLQPPLARGIVRYVGEPVAVVIARSRYLAEDALDLMEVDYQPLDAVTDARRAVEPGAPVLHAPIGCNVADRLETNRGDARAALAAAPHRVRERFAVQRHTACPSRPGA
jgi:carbon-monoxide dehydrogenase large subunit